MQVLDGLKSLINGLGDPTRDKASSGHYQDEEYSDGQLKAIHRSSWVAGKLVNIPVEDSLRKWRTWQVEQVLLDKIEQLEKALQLQQKLMHCKILSRVYGGAAIYIGTDQDPSEPLVLESIKQGDLKYLTVLSRKELTAGDLEKDPFSPRYGKPKHYQVANTKSDATIDPSRLVVFVGKSHLDPWEVTGPNLGWGDSVIQSTYDVIRNADSTAGNIASLIFEANVDVINFPDLMQSLSNKDYEKRFLERMSLAGVAKGINRTLILDSEETYTRKQISFAQLPEILKQFMVLVSAAADIPLTRFLGQSPGGLNATGEGDMKNYYDKVQSIQTLEIQPALNILDEVLIRSSLGRFDDSIYYNWSPLEQMSEEQVANIGKITADTAESLSRSNLYMDEELREAVTNQLVEVGAFPGLDKIVEESGDNFELDDPLQSSKDTDQQ